MSGCATCGGVRNPIRKNKAPGRARYLLCRTMPVGRQRMTSFSARPRGGFVTGLLPDLLAMSVNVDARSPKLLRISVATMSLAWGNALC